MASRRRCGLWRTAWQRHRPWTSRDENVSQPRASTSSWIIVGEITHAAGRVHRKRVAAAEAAQVRRDHKEELPPGAHERLVKTEEEALPWMSRSLRAPGVPWTRQAVVSLEVVIVLVP